MVIPRELKAFDTIEFCNILNITKEKLNKELLKVVDIRYGKPYEEQTTNECDKFIYNLISGSKDEIKKIAESGIY